MYLTYPNTSSNVPSNIKASNGIVFDYIKKRNSTYHTIGTYTLFLKKAFEIIFTSLLMKIIIYSYVACNIKSENFS